MSKIAESLYSDDRFEFLISLRKKGWSKGPYASLNLGLNTDDDIEKVAKNRKKFLKKIGADPETLVFAKQIHGADIREVSRNGYYLNTDGLMTDRKDLLLSITVADCFPVFLADPENKRIALLHAGWRGVAAGIVEKGLKMLKSAGADPSRLIMAVGPGISRKHFEVGLELKRHFPDDRYWDIVSEEKGFLDLKAFIADIFVEFGGQPDNLFLSGGCTFEDADKYFSHRRDSGKTGRMMAVARIK